MTTPLPFGTWPSPISPELIVEDAATPTEVWAEGGRVWWSETRPSEGGRIQIVALVDGSPVDVLGEGFNARTRVHEYGGGAWWVDGTTVFFANWSDQRVYRMEEGSEPVAITPEPPSPVAWRYADGRVVDATTIVCVREDHTGDGEAINEIVAMPAGRIGEATVLVTGRDFVSSPRISPDGTKLAWIAWDHPNMPWDDTELWVADLDLVAGSISDEALIAGGDSESVMQPEWGPNGELYVVSDRSDWWNVYRVDVSGTLVNVLPLAHEVGLPAWIFGRPAYGIADDGSVILTYSIEGSAQIARVDPDGMLEAGTLDRLSLGSVRVDGSTVVAIATSTDREAEVVSIAIGEEFDEAVLQPARDLGIDPAFFSRPNHITFPSADGRVAHAWFYAPASADHSGVDGGLPPLVVWSHGGPTSSAGASFNPSVQYWTSRGFAIVDVNYGGSTGYGRTYRQLLNGMWGVVDVEDCCAAADYLAEIGAVDGGRLAIRGGSAGGYTTLAALAFTDTFGAGANHYGVSDIGALMEDTHKFESRYDASLIGPMPESEALLRERSPIFHVDGFSCPLITFQGLEDAVVPPSQSEAIVNALDERRIPNAYLTFEGEQHGFRKAETIVAVLNAEVSFYGQVFGFEPAGIDEPVEVRHL